MNRRVGRLASVLVSVALIWLLLAVVVPPLMSGYAPYVLRPGFACSRSVFTTVGPEQGAGGCRTLADLYAMPAEVLLVDAMGRSLALVLGAAVLALFIGTSLGIAIALLHRRVWFAGGIVGALTIISGVPSFFVAYFLQITVIAVGASATSSERLLPVYGFGYDEHLVLPLLSIAAPAVTFTAQLTATRLLDVLTADFVLAARAKGLSSAHILAVHVMPHVRPVLLEGLASGLRISVASLPIIEYLFLWRGVGQLALEAIGVHDSAGFIFSMLVLASGFTLLSAIADLSRPRALFAP